MNMFGLLSGTTGTTAASPYQELITMVVIMAIFIALMWFSGRKQRKYNKMMAERRKNLKTGDRVMMSCGIYGTVSEVKDDIVTIEIGASKTPLVFNTQYVAVVEYDDDAEDLSKKEAEMNADKQ